MKFYQACYGKDNTGWGIFNISSDIPSEALTFFERVGSNCNPHLLNETIDEEYEIFKIVSDKGFSCVYKSKYAGRDNFGRPKMFTHGFILDSLDYINNPDTVLSISNSNYRYSIEETSVMPEVLQTEYYEMPYKLNTELLKCVYILLASKYDFPLYVICDTSEKTIKTIIHSILMALPISLRSNLSFSNSEAVISSGEKIIVFSQNLPQDGYFYSVNDNKTNLTDELKRFDSDVSCFPSFTRFIQLNDIDFLNYCKLLEKKLKLLNLSDKPSVENISVADKLIFSENEINQLDDKSLLIFVRELLLALPLKNENLDGYISVSLKLCCERRISIPLPIFKRAAVRFENTNSIEYEQSFLNIIRFLFAENNDEYANNFLIWIYERSHDFFCKWKDIFISNKIKVDFSEICLTISKDFKSVNDYQDISNCFDLNDLNQESKIDFLKRLIDIANNDLFKTSFADYEKIYHQLQTVSSEFPNYKKAILDRVAENYWNSFSFKILEFEEACIKALSFIKPVPKKVIDIIEIYKTVELNQSGETIKNTFNFFEGTALHTEECQCLSKKLIGFLSIKISEKYKKSNFQFWYYLSEKACPDNPISIMIEYKMPVICDTDDFRRELSSDNFSGNVSKLETQLSEEIINCGNEEISAVLTQNLKLLKQKSRNTKIKNIFSFGKKE